MKLEPAASLIEKLGGPTVVAEAAGCDISRVYRWTYSKLAGGTDGRIPSRHLPAILALARQRNVNLTIEEVIAMPSDQRVPA